MFEKFPDKEKSLRSEGRFIEDRAVTLGAGFSCEVVNLLRICNSETCQDKNHLPN